MRSSSGMARAQIFTCGWLPHDLAILAYKAERRARSAGRGKRYRSPVSVLAAHTHELSGHTLPNEISECAAVAVGFGRIDGRQDVHVDHQRHDAHPMLGDDFLSAIDD